jgi:hypothetical protein
MRELFNDWTIPRKLWEIIRPMLGPGMTTLETGSGLSTLLFEAAQCRHTALEHDERFAAPSRCVLLRPLAGTPPWYDWEPTDRYDLILIDGPPASFGREGILRVFKRLVNDETIVVLDDTHRPAESRLAATICRGFGFEAKHYAEEGRGFAVLRRSSISVEG